MTQRIIIDTDPGVDDAVALWLALASPQLEIVGITTVAGNVPLNDVCQNAGRILALSGRLDVPLFAGAAEPLVGPQRYGKYAHIGAFPPQLLDSAVVAPQAEHAVDFIVRSALAAAEKQQPLTLCALGPLTNLALALIHSPAVARGIERIVLMGGAFSAMGHRTPWAEFNLYADPQAAQRVFSSQIPLVMMPLDMTFQALLTAQQLNQLAQHAGEPGRAIARLFTAFDRSDPQRFAREGGPVHDATVIAWLLQPDLFSGQPVTVGIASSGATAGYCWADFYHKLDLPANATVMRSIDEAGFLALLQRTLAYYGHAASSEKEQ
ncbi:nucleoside hydrolase [Erwiniaceae bacterium BAC15a-03b]|uniref:Nucleoside hydrolase n=1 Tax=Winslowiella arboricola TaxID=2978220 RepID=A0A9J6PUW5_9GAMM|nr:nucleoside hydrolase [Winslowiella arboricola]MCU5775672.1 nucleoside hydrolase [Winslowiella arboricola]MCU5779477.1 nucleoside hydrolase [Winslowiella arboricola]